MIDAIFWVCKLRTIEYRAELLKDLVYLTLTSASCEIQSSKPLGLADQNHIETHFEVVSLTKVCLQVCWVPQILFPLFDQRVEGDRY